MQALAPQKMDISLATGVAIELTCLKIAIPIMQHKNIHIAELFYSSSVYLRRLSIFPIFDNVESIWSK